MVEFLEAICILIPKPSIITTLVNLHFLIWALFLPYSSSHYTECPQKNDKHTQEIDILF
jgi:hypothetical protein